MIYLITQLAGFLLLAALAAGVAGWAFAAIRAQPRELALKRDRDRLVRDLAQLAAADLAPPAPADAVELDELRSRVEIKSARMAELERAFDDARSRADDAAARIAELERDLERQSASVQREAVADFAHAVEVEATPVAPAPAPAPAPDPDATLQAWRLRYFEQRVRYLENGPRDAPKTNGTPMEWRARVAEARAAHLEQEVRDAERAPRALAEPVEPAAETPETSAFAADVETDALLRWRMLYLERRVAHLQGQGAAETAAPQPVQATAAPATEAGPDPDRWKWRARYLEARVRHLESRLSTPAPPSSAPAPLLAAPAAEAPPAEPAAPWPGIATERPSSLVAARDGAPDDFRLIDGVSAMLQSTLYSLGVFHFDQIAAWTPANVAWVDQYLRLRGRIDDEEWVDQADALAREGPAAARREETEPA